MILLIFFINSSLIKNNIAGLIYYWISSKSLDITLKEFANKTQLSELTIKKVAKEIADVLGMPFI
jgi:hypothetical protein